jgi:calmodulin
MRLGTGVQIPGANLENPYDVARVREFLSIGNGQLNSNEIAKCRMAFESFDTDGSGSIDAKEFQDLAFSLGEILTDEEAAASVSSIDTDGNGVVEFNEFVAWWANPDRQRRDGVPGDDAVLNRLRVALLAKYAINLASGYTDSVNKLAQSVEIPKSSAGVVHFGVSFQIGAMQTVGSGIHVKFAHVEDDAERAVLRFHLAQNITESQKEQIASAANGLLEMVPPGAPVTPVASVEGHHLVFTSPLPEKASNLRMPLAILPPGTDIDIDLKLNQDPSTQEERPWELKIGASITLDRSLLGIVGAFAPSGAAPVLNAAQMLNNVELNIGFDELGGYASYVPVQSFKQIREMASQSLGPLIAMGFLPPPVSEFINLAKRDQLLGALDTMELQIGNHKLVATFTELDLTDLLPL